MLRKLAKEMALTVSFNMRLAKLQLNGYGRRRFRAGFDSGYSVGHDHGVRGLTKPARPGLPDHPQIEVDGVEVDHLMAPLLRALWDLGLETQFSCQGDPQHYTAHEPFLNFNRAQIVFADFDQACKFVRKTMELLKSAAFSEELFHRVDVEAGIAPHSLEITITETPKVNWGIRGSNAADLTLGYKVEV